MTTRIPLDGTAAQHNHISLACIKMGLKYELKISHGNTREMWLEVEHESPIDLYYLGVNVVAESVQLFKSAITR